MFKKSVVLVLFTASLPAFAMRGGDFGAGNGGDGLEMTNLRPDDVVVTPPDQMGQAGLLEVVGTPGIDQVSGLQIYFCKTDTNGKIEKFGCRDEYIYGVLNQNISLTPGAYRVEFSGAVQFVQVKPNQKSVLQLQNIQIPQTANPLEFTVFADLTDPSMQDQFLEGTYTDAGNANAVSDCDPKRDHGICAVWESGDYHRLLNTQVRFKSDATYLAWAFGVGRHFYMTEGRIIVARGQTGGFVSVFAGVYGIEFKDSTTGEIKSVYGIHAE